MDLNKHLDFFNTMSISETIHIIGVGATGSNTAIQLVRLGFENFILYDFDTVNPHNLTNQMYENKDVDQLKVTSIKNHMLKINPKASIEVVTEGWVEGTPITGYLFMCVDSIELRKKILTDNKFNASIQFVSDTRIGLEEAQMYAANWRDTSHQKRILSTMNFRDDEVSVPISSCGTQLTVLPTIQMIVSLSVMNFINFLKTKTYNYQSVVNSIQGIATSYK